MDWKVANRALVWAGPAISAGYAGALGVAGNAAPNNQTAKRFIDGQIDMIAFILSSATAMAWVALVVVLWASLVWLTDWLDGKERRRANSLHALGERAKVCAQGIVRLMALHRQREAIAMQYAWANDLDRQFFLSSATVMGDYEVLYSHEALAIVNTAERKGVPLDDRALSVVEHPTNPLGVAEVGRHLALIADRIETNDI